MRCKVETRKVVKTKPETKCERVPKETCRKHACNPLPTKSSDQRDESGCYMREQTVSESLLLTRKISTECSAYDSMICNTPISNKNEIETKPFEIGIIKQVQVIKMKSVKKERT